MPNIPLPRRGASLYRSLDLDEGSAEVVKASKGCLLGFWATNRSTAPIYLKFYDRTSATAGTHTPVLTIPIPGNSTDEIMVGLGLGGIGIQFNTGICMAATTGLADADTGAPSANDLVINVFYI